MEAYRNSTEHIIPRLARFHIKFTDWAAYYAAFDEYHVKHNLGVMEKIFAACGFQVKIHEQIQKLVWHKLFTNVSLSVLTGILQVDMGFIAENEHAWKLTGRLIHEAVEVANRQGLGFDEEEIAREVRETSLKNPKGCTSIRADLRDGRRTEVDTISGAVVEAARRLGMDVPYHEMAVELVHSMENRTV